jgi:hypothetical protein
MSRASWRRFLPVTLTSTTITGLRSRSWDAWTKPVQFFAKAPAATRMTIAFPPNWRVWPSRRGAMRKPQAGSGAVFGLTDTMHTPMNFWEPSTSFRIILKPGSSTGTVLASRRLRESLPPSLLDRALDFAPGTALLLPQLQTSQARVEGLEIFPVARFRLSASANGKFDAVLNFVERNGFGVNQWEALLSTLSGVAYQTIYPAYFNLGHSAINITGLVRWDAQKRRLEGGVAGPLHQNPKWRYRLGFDLRNENWEIRDSFAGPAPVLGALNLRREAATAEIQSFNSGRWDWSGRLEFSHRDYRNVVPGTALTPQLLLIGPQLKQLLAVHYELWRVPERRFTVTSSASSQLARIWSDPSEAFAKLQGALDAHWYPKSEGDDYESRFQIRAGNLWGQPPFDELYILGMERDNDLWMRAHVGTHDGRKGSAPLGVRYFLFNSELNKNLYGNGLFTVGVGPFLDSGKITDPSGSLGARAWLWDTGAQAKLRILGVGFTFIYGKDLRTGNNAYYFTTGR